MNRISPPLRGLYWKDARQLFPLVLMLVGMSVFLVVIWSTLDITSQFGSIIGDYIPLTMPALYAAGVGAILVGQEKETRTLLWCSSLPIAPSRIAIVKYVVAVIGLLLMWVCSLVIGGFAGIVGPVSSNWVPTPGQLGPANALYWFLHSVFVLCCGFYTTWKFKNTFASLVALIPIASLPYLATQAMYTLFTSGRYISLEESAGVLSVATIVGIIVFSVLGYRAALKHLSPTEAEQDASSTSKWLAAWRPATSVPIPDSPFHFSLSSLVWQSIHHNRLTLIGLFSLMMLGMFCLVLLAHNEINHVAESVLSFGVVAGAVAVSWLGVFAFNGDGSAARMRFLADRGISPRLAWIGRQLIGLSMIATLSLVYAIASYWLLHSELIDAEDTNVVFSLTMFSFVVFMVYSVSQWTSQLIRILAASAFVAPVVSGAAVAWLIVSATTLETPWWMLLLCVMIPLLATLMMMRRYMDNSVRWPIWANGIVAAGLVIILPVVPLNIEIARWPAIPKAVRAELVAEAMALPPARQHPQTLSISSERRLDVLSEYTLTEARALEYLDSQDDSPRDFVDIGDTDFDSRIPLHANYYFLDTCANAANYFKIKFLTEQEDETSLEKFGEWIEAFAVIARRLRLSDELRDQHWADAVEIWLTRAMLMPELEPFRDREFSQHAIHVITDQATRNSSRRRAILATWREDHLLFKKTEKVQAIPDFGGFDKSDWFFWYQAPKRNAILNRSLDSLVEMMVRLVDEGSRGEDTEGVRRELHQLMLEPTVPFSDGPYGRKLRASVAEDTALSFTQPASYPACQWYGPWETEAMQLKTNQ